MTITSSARDREHLPGSVNSVARGPASRVLLFAIYGYQQLRAGRPTGCRYLPTCSAYADEAIRRYGMVRGLCLAFCRLSRCRPWGGHGVDPVPDRSSR
ncbi:MAG: membrane protein insertion efficiency factor YidD [Acidimicrobiales bacterium]